LSLHNSICKIIGMNKLEVLEKERLQQELIEGYQARKDEDSEFNREWEDTTLENW
jgi:hypothetical protein